MKKYLILILIVCVQILPLIAQTIPDQLTFHFVQFKVTIGQTSADNPPSSTCTIFIKTNNKIISTDCNSEKSNVEFIITAVQSEKKSESTYSITYYGYSPDASSGPTLKGFFTYGYNYSTHQWNILIEHIADNNVDGIARTLLNYFNN